MSKCPICGEPSFKYYGNERKDKLCGKHANDLKEGKIIQCENCGKWHNINESCICKIQKESSGNTVVVINNENKSRCITCGKKTDGLLFCPSCYVKYKDKGLLLKITNCSNVELLDDSYEGRYTCRDGHVVKSKSEREIDNYLWEKGIAHAYEKTLPYGKEAKDVLHPDFWLPNFLGEKKHVYIEHWGYDENNIKYTNTKKFKLPIYKQLGITLICVYEKVDSNEIEATLDRKLSIENIEEGKINFLSDEDKKYL